MVSEGRHLSQGRVLGRNGIVVDTPDSDEVLLRFDRLMRGLLSGQFTGTTFRPWEVELLLDIEACRIRQSSRDKIFRRYQRTVQRQLEKGAGKPMMLSEFLAPRKR